MSILQSCKMLSRRENSLKKSRGRGVDGVTAVQKTVLHVYVVYVYMVYVYIHITSIGHICAGVNPHVCLCMQRPKVNPTCLHYSSLYLLSQDPLQNTDLAARGYLLCSLPGHPVALTSGFWNTGTCHNCSTFYVDSADPNLKQQTFDLLSHHPSPDSFFSLSQIFCET